MANRPQSASEDTTVGEVRVRLREALVARLDVVGVGADDTGRRAEPLGGAGYSDLSCRDK